MPTPRLMEHPDRSALGKLDEVLGPLYPEQRESWFTPRSWIRSWRGRVVSFYNWLFGEENFQVIEATNHRAERDRSIRLEEIALGGARRLNGHRGGSASFKKLDLDGAEIVAVLCETARILLLDGEVRERLVQLERQKPKEIDEGAGS